MKVFIVLFSTTLMFGATVAIHDKIGYKAPGAVLDRIDEYFENKKSLDITDLSSTDQQIIAIEQCHEMDHLLKQALEAFYLCQISRDSDAILLNDIQSGAETFSADSNHVYKVIRILQVNNYDKENPSEISQAEFSLIRADCLINCEQYKPVIDQSILRLREEYKKLRLALEVELVDHNDPRK